MINSFDHDTAIIIGLAEHAMAYHARNGGAESREMAVARMKEAADRLGFDMVPRKTPAQLHDEAVAARKAEDDGGAADAAAHGVDITMGR